MLVKFDTAKKAFGAKFSDPCGFSVSNEGYDGAYDYIGREEFEEEDILNAQISTGEEHYLAPTQTQLQKWLRENHNIHIVIGFSHRLNKYDYAVHTSDEEMVEIQIRCINTDVEEWCKYNHYEDALEDALVEGLSKIKTV